MPQLLQTQRCPVCNRYGSPKMGGYCTRCYTKIEKENRGIPLVRKDFKAGFGEGFKDKEWMPESFGIIKESF